MVAIRSGETLVLDSGEVTTFFGAGLDFDVVGDGWEYALRLRLVDDPEDPAASVRTEIVGGDLEVYATNFTDGRGSATPVLLAEVPGGYLFFHFRVQRFGATADRTVHYTFYLSPPNLWDRASAEE